MKKTKLGFLEALSKLRHDKYLEVPCSNGAVIQVRKLNTSNIVLTYHEKIDTMVRMETVKTDYRTIEKVVLNSMTR